MTAELRKLDRPTTDEALQERLLAMLRKALALAENGEICAAVVVPIQPDMTFQVWREGNIRRLQTVGYLAQAQYDLLSIED